MENKNIDYEKLLRDLLAQLGVLFLFQQLPQCFLVIYILILHILPPSKR